MKTIWLIAIVVSASLISIMATACPCTVKADSTNSIMFDSGVAIFSPLNTTYYYNNLVLNLSLYSAGIMGGLDPQISMNYSIDGVYNGSVPLRSNGELHVVTVAVATVNLPELLDGSHYLTIYLYGLNQRIYQPKYLSYINTIYFSTISNPALSPIPTPSSIAIPPLNPALVGSFGYYGSFWISSPTQGMVYKSSNLFLKIDGEILAAPNLDLSLAYSLDKQEKIPINFQLQPEDHWDPFLGVINCSLSLPPLISGEHNVIVYGRMAGDLGNTQASVNFTVDNILPTIYFVSAQNNTYNSPNVMLNFVVNKPVSHIFYSLDNYWNATVNPNGSLALTKLSNGDHNVTIYAQDEYGLLSSPSVVYFSVKAFPTSTVTVVLGIVMAVLVVAGLLVYYKKHTRKAV